MKARGLGRIYQPTYTDKKTGEQKQSAVWWVQYSYRGRRRREPSGSTARADAVKLLKRRLGEIGRGKLVGPDAEKTTFEHLAEMLLNDYRANGRRSVLRAGFSVARLKEMFAEMRALDITLDRITAYIAKRQADGAANATVNRELAALKLAFALALRAGKVDRTPYIPRLHENNVRTGFFELDQFQAMLPHFSEDLKPVVTTAYITGWRVRSEILTRQWPHVDFRGGWLRLEPGEAKNEEGRMFPLTPDLRTVLERQLARTREIEKATGRIIPWVFHRNGEPIKDLRGAWARASHAAGLTGRIPHDFRRTAVRNLERAGVPRSAAMKMVGHRTEAIYRRYAIADEGMLRDGAVKLAALHEMDRQRAQTLIPLSKAARQ